ncbi:hypothetical protein PMAYCL1PPCAC_14207, partial [Pristionchus mayeri]
FPDTPIEVNSHAISCTLPVISLILHHWVSSNEVQIVVESTLSLLSHRTFSLACSVHIVQMGEWERGDLSECTRTEEARTEDGTSLRQLEKHGDSHHFAHSHYFCSTEWTGKLSLTIVLLFSVLFSLLFNPSVRIRHENLLHLSQSLDCSLLFSQLFQE